MKIGYDAKRIVRHGTGLGSYGRTLINSLSALSTGDELLLYAPDSGRDALREQVQQRDGVRFVYSGRHNGLAKSLWRSHGIVENLRQDGVQLYHGLSGELPVGLRKAGIPAIVTIHDLIFMRHPEYFHALDAWIYKRKFYQTLREADRIIAISERTKQDIIDLGGYPADRIDLVYQSCDTRYRLQRAADELQRVHAEYDLPPRYILSVGTIEVRKNVLLAVKALEKLPADLSLILVGRQTKYAEHVKRYIRSHQMDHRVRFLQGIPNADLPAIYQLAEAFVYPSRYEGFGIPIIEAIQSGLPVVAATGSCLEEAGGPDCFYVDPDDVDGLRDAVLKAIAQRDRIVPRAQDYIRRFENGDVARQVLACYQRTLDTADARK